jgi:hypothetical protein
MIGIEVALPVIGFRRYDFSQSPEEKELKFSLSN